MYGLTDYGAMLRDRRRIEAYTGALRAAVTPTSTVLDLGSGLGTFSIVACKLGAARVYAVELTNVITVAEEVARANGVAGRIEFIRGRGVETELPERVDVIVTDMAGALPVFEDHLPSVIHAREHFLKPGGVLIPRRDSLLCAPVSSAELYGQITEVWKSLPDVDFGPVERMAVNTPYALAVRPEHIAAEPREWMTLDYATLQSPNVSGDVQWTISAATTIHGIALWFESTLHEGITHTSGPWSPGSVHATIVLPLAEPLAVRGGEALRFRIEATLGSGRYVTTWQVNDAPRQSTFLETQPATASIAGTFRVSERVLSKRVGEDVVLLELDSGTYHTLNETGARVWEVLQGGGGIDSAVAAIAAEYDVDAEQVGADVAGIVAKLEEERLIVRA